MFEPGAEIVPDLGNPGHGSSVAANIALNAGIEPCRHVSSICHMLVAASVPRPSPSPGLFLPSGLILSPER